MATTTFTVAVGATQQLDLVLKDAAGNPGTLVSGPDYITDSPSIVSISPDAAGVLVTGLAVGTAKVFANGVGADNATLTAESDGTVTLPLAVAMELVPVAH